MQKKQKYISYAGQTAEAAFSDYKMTVRKQMVQVIKKDKDTENTLSGGHLLCLQRRIWKLWMEK